MLDLVILKEVMTMALARSLRILVGMRNTKLFPLSIVLQLAVPQSL